MAMRRTRRHLGQHANRSAETVRVVGSRHGFGRIRIHIPNKYRTLIRNKRGKAVNTHQGRRHDQQLLQLRRIGKSTNRENFTAQRIDVIDIFRRHFAYLEHVTIVSDSPNRLYLWIA